MRLTDEQLQGMKNQATAANTYVCTIDCDTVIAMAAECIESRAEIAALKAERADGWVSTAERLPEKGQECWVTDGTYVLKTVFPKPVYDNSMPYFGAITHWMPAQTKPTPPEG
jgi:hypothetical protein